MGKTAPSSRHNFFFFFFSKVGEILGSKVPLRYIQHRVNSRRGIAGLSCIKMILPFLPTAFNIIECWVQ